MPSNAILDRRIRPCCPCRRMRILAVLISAVMLALPPVQAQTLPQGVAEGPSMAGITEYSYPNGLRVLLLPDPGSSTITVNVTYLVGSRHEGYGETGMAHLLEHLLFIESVNGRSIKEELDDHGARWNGTTWYDRTNYFETVNASDTNLLWMLDLEAERMVNIRVDEEVLNSEMTVVRNEFERGENSVTRILDERVFSTAYLWHNYGKSTIGARSDIENVTIDRLAAFYRKYYQPDNAVVTIAGAIDPSKTLAMVAGTLGAIPRPTRRLGETYTVEPPQDGERVVELRRVGSGQNLLIGYHAPAAAHPDTAALEVLANILTGGGTGRLNRALEETEKALSVDSSVYELHDPGLFLISATLNNEQSIDEVKSVIFEAVADLGRTLPTPEEVDRAKTRLLQTTDRAMADSRRLAMQLNESIASGDWRLLFTNYGQIVQVTSEDVQGVAGRYFQASNRTVGTFIAEDAPVRTVVPESPETEVLLASYTPEIDVEAGEALDPTPASLEERIERSILDGGIRVALLPKETRGGRVQASLTVRFGDADSLVGQNAAAELAGALLLRGTGAKSRQEIQDELQDLDATVRIDGNLGSANVSISATAETLIPTLRLAVEILQDPAFPESDFEQLRSQRIARIERGQSEPQTLVSEMLQRHITPYPRNDVRYVRTSEEEIEDLDKLTLNEVEEFHRRFYGASQGELVIVGKFDVDEVEEAAPELLGSWQSRSSYSRIINQYSDVEPINSKIETPDKENAQISTGLRLRLRDSDEDYAALLLANYMFGGGGLTARLPDRVRNREGLSYSVRSSFSAPVEGDAALFSAFAIANPSNVPSVEESFMDELTLTLREGFTEEELASAKSALLSERTSDRSSDSGLLSVLTEREQWGRTLAWDEQLEAKLEALTLDEVNAAFRRHIDPEAISIVKGGDFRRANVYQ
jgi:zinc protease